LCNWLVAFGAGGAVAVFEPVDLPGVDREHLVARPDQRLHPRAPVGLDPDHHLTGLDIGVAVPGDQLVQPGDPFHSFGQPGGGQLLAGLARGNFGVDGG
jgi:hypothetical protein